METKNIKNLNSILDSLLDVGWKLSSNEMLYIMKYQPNLYSYFEGIDLIGSDWLLGKNVLLEAERGRFTARASYWRHTGLLTCIDQEDIAWDINPEEIIEILNEE